ncbi:hypothetical protein NADFUDRAFT_40437 [Nadsonia fulvescens var. elongata DSM 6958]|uniref:arginyltransferase n=1 Tax=Nadsonia fulvescens var. elongata DSM 6958 TaxID=857566 RepID=A0A1E3PPN1_9ASCO|nr:hypothetical protein NADFUDRAFT_40437 [Nadsonia fulvescens var. elongata DSM 6958]
MNNIISPGWYRQGGECGYCHDLPKGPHQQSNSDIGRTETSPIKSSRNNTFNFFAQRLDMDTYVKLLNRGYRRSGSHIYKPDARNSCCSMYSIRVPVDQYKASKEQRQSINRFNEMLCQQSPVISRLANNNLFANSAKKSKSKGKENAFDLLGRVHQYDRAVLLDPDTATAASVTTNTPVKLLGDNSTLYPSYDFEVRLEEPTYTRTKYELFERYQSLVHGETDTTPESFKRFLCDNPFYYPDINTINRQTRSGISRVISFDTQEFSQPSTSSNDGSFSLDPHLLRGPVHQCYYHHGKLICMGVLDLLPRGIVSVYLMWDPDYASSALGRISAMREIALTMELQREYYMMGFYIHDCPKMIYKRGFKPSYILDPAVVATDDDDYDIESNEKKNNSKSATEKPKAWRPIEDYIEYWDKGVQFVSFNVSYINLSSNSDLDLNPPISSSKLSSSRAKFNKQDYLDMKTPGVLTRAQLKQAIDNGEINLLEDILIVIPGSMGKKRLRPSKKKKNRDKSKNGIDSSDDQSDSSEDFQADALVKSDSLTESRYILNLHHNNDDSDSDLNSDDLDSAHTLERIANNLPLKGLYQFADAGMLPPAGQNIVIPVLEELTASVGVKLAKKMLIDFR